MNKEIRTSTIKITNPEKTKSGSGYNFEYLGGVFGISLETLKEFKVAENNLAGKVIELIESEPVSYARGYHFITTKNINKIT